MLLYPQRVRVVYLFPVGLHARTLNRGGRELFSSRILLTSSYPSSSSTVPLPRRVSVNSSHLLHINRRFLLTKQISTLLLLNIHPVVFCLGKGSGGRPGFASREWFTLSNDDHII
ncbi:hypothetical protein AVEN_69870-1 [Araneus ventricosus]|uniref:Uncharacterized protein n=1 Tax=Araneus ventricosus TaxID=182803 RepID=A0A4Y2HEZ7_ARAVE|nr:hypothetical protein AVEN_69870-1 [Araneus ventricosus]